MYEFIMLSLAYIPVGIAKRFFTKDGSFLDNLIGGIGEGLIGEAAEEALESAFGFFTNRNRKAKVLSECVRDTCLGVRKGIDNKTYSDDDIKALNVFLGNIKGNKTLKKHIKKHKESQESNTQYFNFDDEFEKTKNAIKEAFKCKGRKDRNKAIEKIFKSCADSMEKSIDSKLEFKDPQELAEQLLGAETAKDMSKIVKFMFEQMYQCIYEMKYITMADDDRDVVKVMQQIIKDNNKFLDESRKNSSEELIKKLDSYFHLILQQNTYLASQPIEKSNSGEPIPKPYERLAKLSEKDNLVWFEHVCPKCGARGEHVSRTGDVLKCTLCGSMCSIFDKPDDKILARLEDVVLLSTNIGSAIEDIRVQIAKTTGDVSGKIDGAVKQLVLTDAEILDDIAALKAFEEERAEITENALDKLYKLAGENKDGIETVITKLDGSYTEIKKSLEKILKILSKFEELPPIGFGTSIVEPVPESPQCRCGFCKRLDRAWNGEVHTVCNVAKNDADKILELSLVYNNDVDRLALKKKKLDCAEDEIMGVRITVSDDSATIGSLRSDSVDLITPWSKKVFDAANNASVLVINAETHIKIDTAFFQKIKNKFKFAHTVILSDTVDFDISSGMPSMVYDKVNKVFSK